MVPITLNVALTDICDPAPTWRVASVSSNEPTNGLGDGDTPVDWVVTGPHSLSLRAERAGKGSGRVYTITVVATDGSGNTSTGTLLVAVPKSMGRR